jgi:hypothetical protein
MLSSDGAFRRGNAMRSTLFLILASVSLSACSATKDKQAGQAEVARFHAFYDAGRGTKIYDEAGPEMKASMSRESFDAMLDTVHQRLGDVRKADQKGWRVNYGTGGGTVTFSYTTDFALARGQEEFIYRMAGGKPVLAGYHVTSQALLAK